MDDEEFNAEVVDHMFTLLCADIRKTMNTTQLYEFVQSMMPLVKERLVHSDSSR